MYPLFCNFTKDVFTAVNIDATLFGQFPICLNKIACWEWLRLLTCRAVRSTTPVQTVSTGELPVGTLLLAAYLM